MTTTEQELTRIQGAKSALRDAILAKGATLSEDARIDEYAPALRSLPNSTANSDRENDIDLKFTGGNLVSLLQAKPIAEANISLPHATNIGSLLYGCTALTKASISAPIAADADRLFFGCRALTDVSVSLPNVTTSRMIFEGCTSLTSVSIDLPKSTNTFGVFGGCAMLRAVDVSMPSSEEAASIFNRCNRLSDLRIRGLKCSIDLSPTVVTVESLQYIVEHAQEAMEGAVLTLPRALESKLPEETIEAAMGKGFDVSFR